MKISISFLSLLFIALSCSKTNDKEYIRMKEQINQLESQIEVLQDSLSNYEKEFLYAQIIIGIPEQMIQKVGRKNEITMLFQTYDRKLPEYEIFKVEGEEKIKVGTGSNTRFTYNFTPKSIDDDKLELLVKIPVDGRSLEIPAHMTFKVEE